mgnify:CR=1 FL=1
MASGVDVSVTMTPEEVAGRAGSELGDDPATALVRLGAVVDESAHAEDDPTDMVAAAEWQAADDVRTSVRAQASVGSRLLRRIDVRPAMRRRRQLQRAERLRAVTKDEPRPPQPVG